MMHGWFPWCMHMVRICRCGSSSLCLLCLILTLAGAARPRVRSLLRHFVLHLRIPRGTGVDADRLGTPPYYTYLAILAMGNLEELMHMHMHMHMHMPCTCTSHAHPMHIPCTPHAHPMHAPCTCTPYAHAHPMQILPHAHPMHIPCTCICTPHAHAHPMHTCRSTWPP